MAVLRTTQNLAGSLGIKVTHPRVREIDRLVRALGDDLKDLRPAWARISKEVLIPSIKRAFDTKTSQDGEKWAPNLKPKQGELMVKSGRLRKSLTKEGTGSKAVRKFKPMFARIGTNVPYSVPLQWGYGKLSFSALRIREHAPRQKRRSRSGGRRSHLPARRFIAWSPSMRVRSSTILLEYLEGLVAERVGRFNGRFGFGRRARG